MSIASIIGWVVAGLIVGALARLVLPGRQDMGIGLTIVLGIVGAMVGGFLTSLVVGRNAAGDGAGTFSVETAWPGWIMAVVGGVIVLWAATAIFSTRQKRTP